MKIKRIYKLLAISIVVLFTLLLYSNKTLALEYDSETNSYFNTLKYSQQDEAYYIDLERAQKNITYFPSEHFQEGNKIYVDINNEIIDYDVIDIWIWHDDQVLKTEKNIKILEAGTYPNYFIIEPYGSDGFQIMDNDDELIYKYETENWGFYSFLFRVREKDLAPVFSGETYFVTNVDNPLTVQEIKSHITAIDDYDGDVTKNITLKEDNYTAYNSQIGVYTIIFQVNDSSNNIAELTVQVNVTDVTAPIITGQKTYNQSIKTLLDLNIVKDNLTVTDNYDTNLIIVQETDNYSSNYNIPGQYIVKYKAVDTSGNIGYYDVNIHVIDDILPVIEGSTKITKTYDEVLTVSTIKEYLTATDNIDGDITSNIILENDNYTGNGNKLGNYDITFSVTDNAGNKATHIVTIQVIDDLPPLFYVDEYFINVQEGINLTQNDIINLLIKTNQLTITSTTTIKIVDNEYLNNENQPGIYAYSLLVEDVSGKVQTYDLKIKVLADEAKTILNPITKNKSTFFSPSKWYEYIYAPFVWIYNIFQWLWNLIMTIYNWIVNLF